MIVLKSALGECLFAQVFGASFLANGRNPPSRFAPPQSRTRGRSGRCGSRKCRGAGSWPTR